MLPLPAMFTPPNVPAVLPLLMMCEFVASTFTPLFKNPWIFVFMIQTLLAVRTRMPVVPVPAPLMSSPSSTTSAAALLTIIPVVPAARMPPITPLHRIVMDLVMLTAPKPAESRQLISPEVAVFEIAPGKVLHGAVRLHGLTSSPTPETQVRVACACAGATCTSAIRIPPKIVAGSAILFMDFAPFEFKTTEICGEDQRRLTAS